MSRSVMLVPVGKSDGLFVATNGLVKALQENARNAIARHEESLKNQGAAELMQIQSIDTELALALVNKGIKTLEDLAEQAIDDLLDLGIDPQRAGDIIMEARNLTWFKEEYEAQLKAQAEAEAAERAAYEAQQAQYEAERAAYEAQQQALAAEQAEDQTEGQTEGQAEGQTEGQAEPAAEQADGANH